LKILLTLRAWTTLVCVAVCGNVVAVLMIVP
jgi:hypothetical protein